MMILTSPSIEKTT